MRDDPLRRWPVNNFVELAAALADQGKIVVVTGDAHDLELAPAFATLEREGKVRSLIGTTPTVGDVLDLYSSVDVVVSADTGSMHLGALAGAGTVALFGPTNPKEKLPKSLGAVALWGGSDLPCRPCYDGQGYARCSLNECMRSIQPQEVVRAVNAVLRGETGRGGGTTARVEWITRYCDRRPIDPDPIEEGSG